MGDVDVCETVIWALNATGYTDEFVAETTGRLGVAPQPTDLRITSAHVRASSVHFTLTPNQCDCNAVIGLGDLPATPGEIEAETWVAWMQDLPRFTPVSRLVILRAWNPARGAVTPVSERILSAAEVTEEILRSVPDDGALVIDYPWQPPRRG